METRDMAEAVETFRTKFMEGVAEIADRVAVVCAALGWSRAPAPWRCMTWSWSWSGSLAQSQTACQPSGLEGITTLDNSMLTSTCQNLLRTYARPAQSSSSLLTP